MLRQNGDEQGRLTVPRRRTHGGHYRQFRQDNRVVFNARAVGKGFFRRQTLNGDAPVSYGLTVSLMLSKRQRKINFFTSHVRHFTMDKRRCRPTNERNGHAGNLPYLQFLRAQVV